MCNTSLGDIAFQLKYLCFLTLDNATGGNITGVSDEILSAKGEPGQHCCETPPNIANS